MKHSRRLHEQLAAYRDLPPEERRELLEALEADASLGELLKEYENQDLLLSDMADPRPDARLRPEFYAAVEKATGEGSPGLLAGVGGASRAVGRMAFAALAFVILVALGLSFRQQLQIAASPDQDGLADPRTSPTPPGTVTLVPENEPLVFPAVTATFAVDVNSDEPFAPFYEYAAKWPEQPGMALGALRAGVTTYLLEEGGLRSLHDTSELGERLSQAAPIWSEDALQLVNIIGDERPELIVAILHVVDVYTEDEAGVIHVRGVGQHPNWPQEEWMPTSLEIVSLDGHTIPELVVTYTYTFGNQTVSEEYVSRWNPERMLWQNWPDTPSPDISTPTPPPYPALDGTQMTPTPAPYPLDTPSPPTQESEGAAPQPQVVEPYLEPARISGDAWSAGGQYLAYWVHEAADYETSAPLPPGTLTFLQVQSGQTCEYPRARYDGRDGRDQRHTWLRDDRLLVFNDDGSFTITEVCAGQVDLASGQPPSPVEEVSAAGPTRDHFLLLAEDGYYLLEVTGTQLTFTPLPELSADSLNAAAFSPAGDLIAVNGIAGGTTVIDVQTAEIVQTFAWQSQSGLGNIFYPQWLANDSILIRTTVERGPLLLTIGGEGRPLAPLLFDLEASAAQVADGVALSDAGYAVVLYYVQGIEGYREGVWLHTTMRDEATELPFNRAAFATTGRHLILFLDEEQGQNSQYEVWWLELHSNSTEPRRFYQGPEFPYTAISAADGAVAIVAGNLIWVLDEEGRRHAFELPDVLYGGVPSWSPDGRYLSTIGGFSGRPEGVLYVIPAPDS